MKRGWIVLIGVVIAAALVLGGIFLFSGTSDRAVMTCGDYVLDNTTLAYYYWSEYYYFAEAYGNYLGEAVDFSKPLSEQPYDNQRSWETYLLEQTMNTVRDTMAMVFEAEAEGFVLPVDYDATYQQVLLNFSVAAQEGGYASMTDYLRASYGKSADEDSFRTYLYHAHLAAAYADELLLRSVPADPEVRDFFARRQSAYEELYEIDPADETTWLELARADLQQETYQNTFLAICDKYSFLVNWDAVELTPPEGLYS